MKTIILHLNYIDKMTYRFLKAMVIKASWLYFFVTGVIMGVLFPFSIAELLLLILSIAGVTVLILLVLQMIIFIIGVFVCGIYCINPKIRKGINIAVEKNAFDFVVEYELAVSQIETANRLLKKREINIREHEEIIRKCLPVMEAVVKELPVFDENLKAE